MYSMMIAIIATGIAATALCMGAMRVRFPDSIVSVTARRPPRLAGQPSLLALPPAGGEGCPPYERRAIGSLVRRLDAARGLCVKAMDERIPSAVARSRIEPPLEEAYAQMLDEIQDIIEFCDRNDLTGMRRKAASSAATRDIYMQAYRQDIAKVHEAIDKVDACLIAYERTAATLDAATIDTDIGSDFDAALIELGELREELPMYSLAGGVGGLGRTMGMREAGDAS